MANNHVELGDGTQIMDIRDTTATPETVPKGDVFYGADGERKVGTFSLDTELTEQAALITANQAAADNNADLIAQIKTALEGKVAGGSGAETATVTTSGAITNLIAVGPDGLINTTALGTYTILVPALVAVGRNRLSISLNTSGACERIGSIHGAQVISGNSGALYFVTSGCTFSAEMESGGGA